MRFRQIEVFHAIYTTGSISGAARILHVSQPALSKVLAHTEQRLGMALFRRVRGRLVPTDEAHALANEAAEVFRRLTSLQKTASNLRFMTDGHIRLAVVPSLGLQVAPLAIARFRDRHPHTTFEVQTLHHDDLFRALYERSCDIAIGYDAPTHPRLKRRDLADGELVLMFREQDLPDPGARIPLQDLQDRELLGMTTGGPLGDLFNRELQRLEVRVREVVSNQTFYIAAGLTRCGAGMSIVDEFTAQAFAAPGLTSRPLSPALGFKVQCMFLEERPPSGLIEGFLKQFSIALGARGPTPGS
ncbi:LysR substrate-binding domain-containing protein [Luteimonas sp. S4-F44]|uniref:LysR family transcriptional regulator n=1 Tax=Luteimonas sp. S4-F44 TaxID=2925842 RepID=UPI001F537AB7|nr:LysR substrate-binding domain-containing protein [Luteimonas sp. S4-F44]UNK41019.1 LysR substrate-binding domain-containing protein [Luteimonas sp. S4-F44]